jgi:DNA-binding MurR/RpiR family transcriptional regulator
MATNNLIERIRALNKLTPSEAKMADFFARQYPETVFENVTSISNKTGVSKATVVRFISRLGYKSFYEFQEQLRYDVVLRLESPIKRFTLKKKQLMEGEQDVLGQNFSYIMKNLQRTHAQIDQDTFMKVAQMIADPERNLYIMGQRVSYALGNLFQILLRNLRSRTFLLDSQASMLPDLLVDVSGKDMLFVITLRRYARLSLKVAEHFFEQGARVILFTDSEFSPLSHLAHLQLVVPSQGLSTFRSFCATIALLESLIIAALQFCEDSIYNRFEEAEKLYKDFETFCPEKTLVPGKAQRPKKQKKGQNRPLKKN